MYKIIILIGCICLAYSGFAQDRTLFGRVLSSDGGKPLAGATITVKESNQHAVSDTSGNFALTIPEKQMDLHISHVGFISQSIFLSKEQNIVVFYLKADETILKDVIVSTGYQNISKERATGSFTTIDNALLNRSVSTDILSRLENVSSGLLFDKRFNGQPTLSIRGQSTILSDAAPLIVVDNFPYEGDINNINPNDIENVTILKDAAAASIWGARAGNGVIVITTKHGRLEQPLKVELNSNLTIGEKPDLYYNRNFINSADFIGVEKTLFSRGYYSWQEGDPGQTLSPVVQLLIAQRDGQISAADAQSQINALNQLDVRRDLSKYFYQKSVNQQYSVSLRGGQSKVSYFLSGGFDQNKDYLIRNGLDRITLNSSATYFPIKSLEISTNIVYSQNTQNENNTGAGQVNSGGGKGLYPYAQIADANGNPLPVIRDYSSSYVQQADTSGLLDWNYRPLQDLRSADYTFQTENTRINTSAKYYFNRYFNIEGRYQYEHQTTTVNNLQSEQTYYVRNLINQYAYKDASGMLQFAVPLGDILDNSTTSLISHSARGQINFNKSWSNKSDLTALAGIEIRQATTKGIGSRLYGYDDDLATSVPVDYVSQFPVNPYGYSAQIPSYVSLTGLTDRNLSYFANASYAYNKRYIISASARKDESNLFGVNANQKGVPLWSAGLGWLASSEKSFPFSNWLPYLKVRTTYGYNGNVNKSLTAYTTASYSTDRITGLQTAQILTPPNPDLQWEKISIFNAGIDFQTKNNLLSGSFEYYHKKGIDLIGNSPLDPTAGFNIAGRTNFTGNNADMKGHGFDIQLVMNKNIGKISWVSNALFSYATDKVTRYEYKSTLSGYLSFYPSPMVGRPRFGIYSYKWAGLDPQTGDPQVYLNGKVSKDYRSVARSVSLDDLEYNGPALPPYFGSWRNTFSFMRYSVGCNISYKFGYYFRRSSINYASLFDSWTGNEDFEKRWQKPGDEKITQVPSMPAASPDYNRELIYSNSSILVEKGDHIRFQDIHLSYQFDKVKDHWLPFSSLSVYGYINNLGIIWRANPSHIDPDYVFQPYPPSKTYSLGLKIQF
jgi:TonB-dependent starch-binding outer membrane protein SusC